MRASNKTRSGLRGETDKIVVTWRSLSRGPARPMGSLRRTNAGRKKNNTCKVLLKLLCSLFWGEDAIVSVAATFPFSFGASAHGAGIGRRPAVCVVATVHRWKISGFWIRSLSFPWDSRLPGGPEFPFRFSFLSSHVRFAALRGGGLSFHLSIVFFFRGDSRLPGGPEFALAFFSTLA